MDFQNKTKQSNRDFITRNIDPLYLFLSQPNQATKQVVGGQQEQLDTIHDWQDSAEKKLKRIKDRMDELGPEVSHPKFDSLSQGCWNNNEPISADMPLFRSFSFTKVQFSEFQHVYHFQPSMCGMDVFLEFILFVTKLWNENSRTLYKNVNAKVQ